MRRANRRFGQCFPYRVAEAAEGGLGKRELARGNIPHGQFPMYIGAHVTQNAMHPDSVGSAVVEMNVQKVIETVSLFALIVLTSLRPLVAEMYDSAGSPITEALQSVSDPSPLRTLVFDLVILVAMCGWLLARAIGPARRYRWTGLEGGLVLIVIAVVISCVVAGNKRLAINASIDWLCYPLLTIALVQLMPRPWHRRLVLAAVIASAGVQAVQCLDEHFFRFDDTWNHYQSMKAEFWARQGVALDSSKVELFERRMLAREASGFLPHSNITGSYLVLCGLAAAGVAIARWKGAREAIGYLLAGGCTLVVMVILFAVLVTHSLGALMAGLVGAFAWVVIRLLRSWIAAHRGYAVLLGWGCAVAGLAAVVSGGLAYERPPHMSLTFRWQYWRASAELITDHALTGVGRENFGRHYLKYKPIDSPEEVSSPHNLFVQAGADWGLLGLFGVLAAGIGGSVIISRPARPEVLTGETRSGPLQRRAAPFAWAALIIIVLTLCRLPLLDTDEPDFFYFAYYATVTTAIAWLIGFLCVAVVVRQPSADKPLNSPVVATGVAVGLLAFLIHDMINFALFVPGSATACFALLAVGIAERSPVKPLESSSSSVPRWLVWAAVVGITVGFVVLAVRPVARMTGHLRRARSAGRQITPAPLASQLADRLYTQAVAADPLDPTPHLARAEWLLAISTIPELRDEALPLAVKPLEAAIERDPFHVRLRRLLMRLYQAKASHTGDAADYHQAIRAAEAALELYPQDPAGIVALADRQLEAGEATGADDLLWQALETYQRSLDLDDARPQWERIRRLRGTDRHAIQIKMEQLRKLLQTGEENVPPE